MSKCVVIGVTGGIAVYKALDVISALRKKDIEVHVIMTESASKFVNPLTFQSISQNMVVTDMFAEPKAWEIQHISLAQKSDLMLVAPATANIIGKISNGIADDMLSTTALACSAKKIVSPAMNVHMFENPIVQDNLNILKKYDMEVVEPAVGYLACGDTGAGKMPDPEVLYEYIIKEIACEKDLKGKKIMVTAGPTQEAIDPVRYITNHSTGKMGYAIAKRAMLRGADVTLVSGPVALDPVPFVKMVPVTTAQDMFEAVSGGFPEQDILIKAAAVADYRPSNVSDEKVKKRDGDMAIALERTTDILGYVGEHKKPEQIICGFSMETQNMLENSRKKLKKKHLDMIVANNLKEQGAGFGTDTNRVTIISEKEEKNLELMSKEEVADEILNYILEFK